MFENENFGYICNAKRNIDIKKTDIAAGLFHAHFYKLYGLRTDTWRSPRGECALRDGTL